MSVSAIFAIDILIFYLLYLPALIKWTYKIDPRDLETDYKLLNSLQSITPGILNKLQLMRSIDLFQGLNYLVLRWMWHYKLFSRHIHFPLFIFLWVSIFFIILISRRTTRRVSVLLLIIVAVDISTLVKSQSFSGNI